MGKRKPSVRAERRARARLHEEAVRDLDRLARAAPGGSPGRPIDLESPAQVEPIALAAPCPLCEGACHLGEHAAETHAGVRLRVARVQCTTCGVARPLYFRLATALPH